MFQNEILRPCEKIKIIRKEYGIVQKDLAGTNISRQLISLIENGYTDLTEETALKIESNLREVFSKRGMEYPDITASLLLETENKQIKKILDKYNEDLTYANSLNSGSSFLEIQEEIKKIYEKYYNTVKSVNFLGVIKILCETTLKLSKWEEAKAYIMKGIEISNSYSLYDELLIYYNWMAVVGIGLREYKGVLPIYALALDLYGKHNLKDTETFVKVTINTAMACRKLNMNIECVEYLARVEFLSNDPKNLFKIYNLMGKSLMVLKQYDEAEEKLLKALEYAKSKALEHNVDELSTVLENLSKLYLETNRINEAIKYMSRIEQVIDSINDDYLRASNLYYLTIIEIFKDSKASKGKVKSLFSQVINLAAKLKDKLLIYRISYEVCKYLICIDDADGLEKLAETIYKVSIESSAIYERIPNVIHTIAEYFDELSKYDHIRKKISKFGYMLERQICREESFEI